MLGRYKLACLFLFKTDKQIIILSCLSDIMTC